jgi:hypothetical protein
VNEAFAVKIQRRNIMRKLALILATTALFGLAAPAFAIDAGTSVQARTPAAQANVNAGVKAKTGVHVRHQNRGVNKMVQHDRGLHRGFTHSRHLGYAKSHRPAAHAKVTARAAAR